MKPIEVRYLDPSNSESNGAIQAIIDSTDDVESFISHWFVQQREGVLTFLRGQDDATGKVDCLCLVVQYNCGDAAELYYPLDELRQRYPNLTPIDEFVSGYDSTGNCMVDDFAFDEFERLMGYRYNDELCGRLGPRESLLKVALSYVLASRGEAQLSHFEPIDELEPALEVPKLDPDNIMMLSLLYQAPKPVRGCLPMFGNFLYVHAEREAVC